MKTSQQGIEQLKTFEGFRSMPYLDTAGKWTVGYGHLMVSGDGLVQGSQWTVGYGHLMVSGDGLVQGSLITMGQATTLLTQDVGTAERCINDTGIDVTQNEFDALVSFTYNLGVGSLQRSTLLKLIKAGNKPAAALEFPKWSIVAGGHSDSILKRRLKEQACFKDGVYVS